MKEADIQEKVTEEARLLSMIPIRINVTGHKGWPDYGYGYKGRMCFVEFKKPGEKPEPLQKYVHSILRESGFTVLVVDRIDEGVAALVHWRLGIDRDNPDMAGLRASHDPD